jgi:CheY-like chemotaxis protein
MKTLLLADDSVTIQRVIELTFAHEDVRVVSVSDGRRAVQWMDSEAPDIVLADVEVPDMDGYEVAAHVKQSPRLKNVPVLLLAGAFEPVDQERVRSLGCDGVLVKPFEPQQLVSRVKSLLDRKSGSSDDSGAAGGYESNRRFDAEAGTVTPFPSSRLGSGPAFGSEPEPLEPPSRPIWDSMPMGGSVPRGERHEPAAPPPPRPVSLANAFSALLAAEQSVQPAVSSAPPPAAAVSEASIEDAVRRVLGRMTEEQIRGIVLDVAERLVREEIEKIKANPE